MSDNGHEWHQHVVIDGIDPALDVTNRPIQPIRAKMIRLIPITDRKMPVCMRTELFGCYLDDDTVVSSVDGKEVEFLSNELTEDWTKLSGGESAFTFEWMEPRNITHIDVHFIRRKTERGCIHKVTAKSSQISESVDFDCAEQEGVSMLVLPFYHLVSDLQIVLRYQSVLFLSEIVWHEADIVDRTTTVSDQSLMSDYVNFGLIVISALLLILVSFAIAACARTRIIRSRKSHRDSEWLGQLSDVSKEASFLPHVTSRNDQFVQYSPNYTFKHYRHEYSEIGSMAADSGRGGSTASEYAEVQHKY